MSRQQSSVLLFLGTLVCGVGLVQCGEVAEEGGGPHTGAGASGSGASAGEGPGATGSGASGGGEGLSPPGVGGSETGIGAGAGSGGASPGEWSQVIVHADFEQAALGLYSQSAVLADFGAAPSWNNGLTEGRAQIVEEANNRFLRIRYPAGQFGPAAGGVQFKVDLGGDYEELYLLYRIRFAPGFDFVKGGKIPGLVGGSAPTGCQPKTDGFSARSMWRTGGAAVQYVYYPTQPNSCGDDLAYQKEGGPSLFQPGVWHTVEHHLVMNTPGQADGLLEARVDGELVLQESGRVWRAAGASFAIDTLYFSTFFGGGDSSWAPAQEQHIDFDEFIVTEAEPPRGDSSGAHSD